jgi:hypothetical protein
VLLTSAWAVPTIAVASAAPAYAASGDPVAVWTSNFNSIGTGLPSGFSVVTGADTAFPGAAAVFSPAATFWSDTTGTFRNVASATGLTGAASTATQTAATNRAVGVRQTGAFGDPGAAFVVNIGPTTGRTNVTVSFRAQQVHQSGTAGRTTQWTVDGGTGTTKIGNASAAPAFTTVQGTFSDQLVNVSFGSLLDNKPDSVIIRIAALGASANSGSRPHTAIDELTVYWT